MTIIRDLGLSPAALAERQQGIGGSDATALMSGNAERIARLWEEKCGLREPEDLSRNWSVQFGIVTESLNRHVYTIETGHEVVDAGKVCVHPSWSWMRCTLDGISTAPREPVYEAKCCSGTEGKLDAIAQRYMGQVHHQMMVTGRECAVLGVFLMSGYGVTWEMVQVELDAFFAAELIDRERTFWRCVETRTPPPEWHVIQPPAPPSEWRTVDMSLSNAWGNYAAEWRNTREWHRRHETAGKELRALVEPDVGLAEGHGIECRRKGGKLYIKECDG